MLCLVTHKVNDLQHLCVQYHEAGHLSMLISQQIAQTVKFIKLANMITMKRLFIVQS